MHRTKWLCLAIVFWTYACSANLESNDPHAKSAESAGPVERVANGLRYVPVRENHPELYSLARAQSLPARATDARTNNQLDLATLSDEELTQRMTGLTVLEGYIYQVVPEPETVQAVRLHRGESIAGKRAPLVQVRDRGVGVVAQAEVIDDGRDPQLVTNPTAFPYSAITLLNQEDLPAGYYNGGTGVMIGPSTLLSAAHVFYDGANFRNFAMQPGADANNLAPFGAFDCYGVVIATSVMAVSDDYAVVDFRSSQYGCNDSPGNASGWLGVSAVDDATLSAASLYMYGYPIDKSPWPQQWGMSGSAVTPYGSDILSWTMDQAEGQSGSPVYLNDPHSWLAVVAIASKGDSDFGLVENIGPRVTQATIDNIRAWSTDY